MGPSRKQRARWEETFCPGSILTDDVAAAGADLPGMEEKAIFKRAGLPGEVAEVGDFLAGVSLASPHAGFAGE